MIHHFMIHQMYGQLSNVTSRIRWIKEIMIRHFLIHQIFAQMPKFAVVGNIEKRKRQNRQGPPSNVVNQILCQKGQVFSQVGRLRRVEIPYKFFDGEFDEEVTNINY